MIARMKHLRCGYLRRYPHDRPESTTKTTTISHHHVPARTPFFLWTDQVRPNFATIPQKRNLAGNMKQRLNKKIYR
jgi:hypothetical protein